MTDDPVRDTARQLDRALADYRRGLVAHLLAGEHTPVEDVDGSETADLNFLHEYEHARWWRHDAAPHRHDPSWGTALE